MKRALITTFSLFALTALWAIDLSQSKEVNCTLHSIERHANNLTIPSQTFPDLGHFQPTRLHKVVEVSPNWSGYVATPSLKKAINNRVSEVVASWVIPTLNPTPNDSYSACWVGIDGFFNGTVEQIGTAQDWIGGEQHNYAWFEMYPQGAYAITDFPVHTGDSITAEVSFKGKGVFLLTIANNTRKVHTSIPTIYTTSKKALRSSAEWIVEAPSSDQQILPLANFGAATFFDCSAKVNNISGAINNAHWQSTRLLMGNTPHVFKAQPSPLSSNGSRFTVLWNGE